MAEARSTRRLLILGGTGEARELARVLDETPVRGGTRWSVISSLAGRTSTPEPVAGPTRRGGFGGTPGLVAYLAANAIDVIVDATHPFAESISLQAADAAAAAGIACYRLVRPPWTPEPGDTWITVRDVAEAAARVPAGARVFLTIGRQQLAPFLARQDIRLVARMIEPPDPPLPDRAELILARPPFSADGERALLTARRIDMVVTKNAGGDQVRAKLDAARDLGLPVMMIARPPDQPPADAGTVRELLSLLARHDA